MELPAISVIIPLYNAEKYLPACLNSLLAQTFQNFEVVVVDDCSTDSSCAIVESYAERFGGRLTLAHTKKNSGGGGYVPRNIGLGLSRGEYVFFVDSDDFVADTALEKLYSAAKAYDADVVYCGAYYSKGTDDTKLIRDGEGMNLLRKGLEDKPTLIIDDPNKNLQRLLIEGNHLNPWTKFVQRRFLIENEIVFPKIFSGGDFIWVIHVYCCAKKFLRISDAVYFYRDYSEESVTRKKRSVADQIAYWSSAFVSWSKSLNELSNQIDVLKKNPGYGYIALKKHFIYSLDRFFQERMQVHPQTIYEILYREFNKGNDLTDLMLPFLFSVIDEQQKNLIMQHRQFQQFAAQAQSQVAKFNQFTAQARARIAYLEAEIARLKVKE